MRLSSTEYIQNEPIRFGNKKLYLSCKNGGPKIKSIEINGELIKSLSTDEVVLLFSELPENADIEIVTEGGWPSEQLNIDYPGLPRLLLTEKSESEISNEMPESLEKPYLVLTTVQNQIGSEFPASFEVAFLNETIKAFKDCSIRSRLDPGKGYFREITNERKVGIDSFYEKAAIKMYNGIVKLMLDYEKSGDKNQKRIADIFKKAQM